MIPFASQRGGGQDLATHLMNEHDNEYMELAEVRGAIADDLHGAFAEWAAQAGALTKCKQYLCSLSINPDELQGRITREQFADYIDRAEDKLGLTGQPRAVVFHIKEDGHGHMREHCHVVWSRIDVEQGKAVPLSFFKDKLMTVTREFARDHGLELPQGYHRREDEYRRNRQLSGYDGIKQKETGITHEQRIAAVTGAWQRSDSGQAFANALEELGYVLARGRNKTRLVVIDIYGHTTALTRLIDDPSVKAKTVRDKLGLDYAPENLPSVKEAQELAAQHREAIKAFEQARLESEQVLELTRHQASRRTALEQEAAALRQRQHDEREQLGRAQKAARQQLKAGYRAEMQRIRSERARHRPKGLAGFLGRVTGVALVTKKLHRYRDRKRYEAYLIQRDELKVRQRTERQDLGRRQELQAADVKRKLRGLDQVEKRERASLELARTKVQRQRINAGHDHMPTMQLALKPRGRKAVPHKAKNRHTSQRVKAQEKGSQQGDENSTISQAEVSSLQPGTETEPDQGPVRGDLTREFTRVAGDRVGGTEGGDSRSHETRPASGEKVARQRRRKDIEHDQEQQGRADRDEAAKAREDELEKLHREFDGEELEPEDEIDLTDEFTRAAGVPGPEDDGGGGDGRGHKPDSGPKLKRRRKRKRDLGRGR